MATLRSARTGHPCSPDPGNPCRDDRILVTSIRRWNAERKQAAAAHRVDGSFFLRRFRSVVIGVASLVMASCAIAPPAITTKATDAAPIAARHVHAVTSPHGERTDFYYWLRDDTRSQPAVLDYLAAENAYYEKRMRPLRPLADKLYAEITSRIAPDDAALPVKLGPCWYQTRYTGKSEYPQFVRRCNAPDAAEQILLDETELARGHDYYHVRTTEVSPNARLLAYAEDTSGRYQCTIRIKDLATGVTLADEIPSTSGAMAWADDNRTLFYVENDPTTLTTVRVKRHMLGTDAKSDGVVYAEPDNRFYVEVARSGDNRYILIRLESREASETRFLPASGPWAAPRILRPREPKLEYYADHIGDRWVIRTNWNAPNFRVVEADDSRPRETSAWREIVPASDDVLIERVTLLRNYLVLGERSDGLRRIRVIPRDGRAAFHLAPDEDDYTAVLGDNPSQDTNVLRYEHTSLISPRTTCDMNLDNRQPVQCKQAPAPGYDPSNYVARRLWITARDGTKIPVSLAYRKGMRLDGSAPLLQLGYGAYGVSSDPKFDPAYASLLDRGFVVAIAHVRGGAEMGSAWYEAGKLLNKKNTFGDFIDVTRSLVAQRFASASKIFASGRSAGGLLMAVIANEASGDYRAIAASVPFVDVLTTMLDPSVPTTTNEYEEWGDPREKRYYDYILSYSPYDNVRAHAYPALYVTTSLNDSQVQYYEPAKWVAKLRATKTDSNPLLFKIDMNGSHNGNSGRFARYRETADLYAFFLDRLRSSR